MNVKEFFELSKFYHNKLLNLINIDIKSIKVERNAYNYIERTYFNCGANIGILEGLNKLFNDDEKVTNYFNKKRKAMDILYLKESEKDKIFIKSLNYFKKNAKINIERFQNFLMEEYSFFIKKYLYLNNLDFNKNNLELLKTFTLTLFDNKEFLNKDRFIQTYLSLQFDLNKENFIMDKDTFFNYSLIYKIPEKFKKINYNVCFSNFFFLGYSDFKNLLKESAELIYSTYFQFFISEILLHKFLSKKYNFNFFDTTIHYEKYFNKENIPKRIKQAIENDLLTIKLKIHVLEKNGVNFEKLFSQLLKTTEKLLKYNIEDISQINYCLFKHFHEH